MTRPFVTCFVVFFAFVVRADSHRAAQFIGFTNFDSFKIEGAVLTSPEIHPAIDWNELVPSWNYRGPATNGLTLEAKVRFPTHETKWYNLGDWAANPLLFRRQSAKNQADPDGDVSTDTLRMKEHAGALRVRITLHGTHEIRGLSLLGLSFCDTTRSGYEALPPNTGARAKSLPVPERSQADYPEGISSWCSPTAVSMILGYWSSKLTRPDLNHDVPEVARSVNDPNWPGTGNWPFNTAFAGMNPGMRAYVSRFSDLQEIEDWIQLGIPVAMSVSYGFLKGDSEPGNGHLVVCVGFTETGDAIVNDPGRHVVRQIYTRDNLRKAWAKSHNTVYLIYPETSAVPKDRFSHWFTP